MGVPAAHLQTPLYRPVLQEVDGVAPFQPLPDGLQIAGTPEDYIRLTLDSDGTATFTPSLFANSDMPDMYDEIASRILFAMHSQCDNQWSAVSLYAFLKAIVDEYNARITAQRQVSAIQHNTEDNRPDQNLLERVLGGLRKPGSTSGSSTPLTREELPLPEYRFLPSPLMLGLDPQRRANDALRGMFDAKLLDADDQDYFWPTKALTLKLNPFFQPNISS